MKFFFWGGRSNGKTARLAGDCYEIGFRHGLEQIEKIIDQYASDAALYEHVAYSPGTDDLRYLESGQRLGKAVLAAKIKAEIARIKAISNPQFLNKFGPNPHGDFLKNVGKAFQKMLEKTEKNVEK